MSIQTTAQSVEFKFRAKNKGTDQETLRPTLTLDVPLPTRTGIITALQEGGEKVQEMLVSAVQDIVIAYTRSFVDEDLEFDQAKLDAMAEQLDIEAIANLPRSTRSRVTKADIEAFVVDYLAIMPEVTGKSVEKLRMATAQFLEQFKQVAGKNDILEILNAQLELFITNADDEVTGKHERVINHLLEKLVELRKVDLTVDAF